MKLQIKPLIFLSIVLFCFVWVTAVTATTVNIKLNDDLTVPGSAVDSFHISPNGESVVFTAKQTEDSVLELFSVSTVGGANIQLSPLLTQDVEAYKISSDSNYVVFWVNHELFATSTTGGSVIKLATNSYSFLTVLANNNRVVYAADPNDDGIRELYSVPVSGGDEVQLSAPLANDETVQTFKVAESSEYVVYRSGICCGYLGKLFSVPAGGGSPIMLSQRSFEFELSPSSDYILYLENEVVGDDKNELYIVPITGGNRIQVNDYLDDDAVSSFRFSPDGQYVIYSTDYGYVYSVPVSGGRRTEIAYGYRFFSTTPDSRYILLRKRDGLYQVPITGGDIIHLTKGLKLSNPGAWLGGYYVIEISADGRYVVFNGEVPSADPYIVLWGLYSVPVSGGDVIRINDGPMFPYGDGSIGRFDEGTFKISADNRRVIYIVDQDEDNVFELFSVPITGGDSVKLNQPLVFSGGVHDFELVPDNSRVIYRADQETDDVVELFVGFALVAGPDAYIVRQDDSIILTAPGVLENDLQGGMATAVLLTPPAHGNLALNSDGSFTYTPDAAYWGTDSFTYLAHEEGQDSNAATVVINVVKDRLYFPLVPKS